MLICTLFVEFFLQAGDEILSINGLYLGEATHGEVVNILRSHNNLLLKVRSEYVVLVPCFSPVTNEFSITKHQPWVQNF